MTKPLPEQGLLKVRPGLLIAVVTRTFFVAVMADGFFVTVMTHTHFVTIVTNRFFVTVMTDLIPTVMAHRGLSLLNNHACSQGRNGDQGGKEGHEALRHRVTSEVMNELR
jgi:hypothetical protein